MRRGGGWFWVSWSNLEPQSQKPQNKEGPDHRDKRFVLVFAAVAIRSDIGAQERPLLMVGNGLAIEL